MLKTYFDGKELNKSVNPDEVVAIGATYYAAQMMGAGDDECNDIVLIDTTPLSLGIFTKGGRMQIIIPRNSLVPCDGYKTFTTSVNNQAEVDIQIYEGEFKMCDQNHKLKNFKLKLAPAPRGVPKI